MDIRRYLFEHDMTIKQLAQKLEISPTHLSALKKRKSIPSIPVMIKIIEVTNGEIEPKDLIPQVFEAYEKVTARPISIRNNHNIETIAIGSKG